MVALNSQFDILRGWPNSSAVQEDFVIGSATHNHYMGQWVSLDAGNKDGTMKTAVDLASTTSDAAVKCFLIIEGKDDYSSRFANRVTCLLGGGYMVRLPQNGVTADGTSYSILSQAAASFAPGEEVRVAAGVITPLNAAENDVDVRRQAVVGSVIAVDTNANTIDLLVI